MNDLITRLREGDFVADDILEAADLIEAQAKEIAELRDAHRRFYTNTTHGVTMQDRNFSLHCTAICDENFDYDAALEVSGDFPEGDKEKYAQMICGVLNSHMKLKTLCDQLGNALQVEYKRNVDNYHGASTQAKEALTAWRNPKGADNQFAAYDRAAKAMSPWSEKK